MCDDTETIHYMGFLQGNGNFRTQVQARGILYKGNRAKNVKPFWFQNIRTLLLDIYKFQLVDNMETDDALSILQNRITSSTIIGSVDKDLYQIQGTHYNINKREVTVSSSVEALKCLALQILTGDATDNIFGLKGVGPVKAEKVLSGYQPDSWLAATQLEYVHWYKKTYPMNDSILNTLLAAKHYASTFELVYLLREADPEVFVTPEVVNFITLSNIFNNGPGSNREPEHNKTMFD
jgi:hypothetical protein